MVFEKYNETFYIDNRYNKSPAGGTRSVLENVERHFAHKEFSFEYLFSEDGSDKSFDKFVVERGSMIHVLPAFSLRGLLRYIRARCGFLHALLRRRSLLPSSLEPRVPLRHLFPLDCATLLIARSYNSPFLQNSSPYLYRYAYSPYSFSGRERPYGHY